MIFTGSESGMAIRVAARLLYTDVAVASISFLVESSTVDEGAEGERAPVKGFLLP